MSASDDKHGMSDPTQRFKVVVCTRGSRQQFFDRTATGRSLSLVGGSNTIVEVGCNVSTSLADTYNPAIEACRHEPAVMVFMHDDIHLCDAFWQLHMLEALQQFDLVGLAGNKRRLPFQSGWPFTSDEMQWDEPQYLSGSVAHGQGWPPNGVTCYGPTRQEVKLLDGLMLVAHSQTLIDHDIRFDPSLGFHLYDLDLCRQFEAKGLKIGTWDISAIHESEAGDYDSAAWVRSRNRYFKKWGD